MGDINEREDVLYIDALGEGPFCSGQNRLKKKQKRGGEPKENVLSKIKLNPKLGTAKQDEQRSQEVGVALGGRKALKALGKNAGTRRVNEGGKKPLMGEPPRACR